MLMLILNRSRGLSEGVFVWMYLTLCIYWFRCRWSLGIRCVTMLSKFHMTICSSRLVCAFISECIHWCLSSPESRPLAYIHYNLSGPISLSHSGFMHLACLLQGTLIRDQPHENWRNSFCVNALEVHSHIVQEGILCFGQFFGFIADVLIG